MKYELTDGKHNLTQNLTLEKNHSHIHLAFTHPFKVLSSAVLNGGLVHANHLVNCRVPKVSEVDEAPELSLERYCTKQNWQGKSVGLMTAASMDSFRLIHETIQGVDIIVMITAGLSNARRVGDRAEYREICSDSIDVGTINIIVYTSAILTEAAMVEAVLIVTEAKTAALLELQITSPVSGQPVTGTGTDALVIVSGKGPGNIQYCGKHVRFGEVLGTMVMKVVRDSVQWDISIRDL